MPQCLVKTCGNYYGKTRGGNKVIYHMLPSNPQLHAKWVELCKNKKNVKVNAHARVCSDHFSESCYQRDLQHELLGLPLRRKLKPDAFPDQNLPSKFANNNKVLKAKIDSLVNQNENKNKMCKLPMRSSIRIAKKKSIECLNDSTNKTMDKNAENFPDKLRFMSELLLKFERKENSAISLPTYDFELSLDKIQELQKQSSETSLTKMQIMEDVREGCSVQPSSPGHAEERVNAEETNSTNRDPQENGFEDENSVSGNHLDEESKKEPQIDEEIIKDDKPSLETEHSEADKAENSSENNVNEESCSNTSSEETLNNKRKLDNQDSSNKRLRMEIQENFISRDKILNEFIDIADCNTVEQMQIQTEQILAEIRTLNELAREKEREWNNIIHLKKMKEELLLRMQRRKQVMLLSSDKNENGEILFGESQTDSVGERLKNSSNQSILKANLTNPNKSLRIPNVNSGYDKNKHRNILPKPQQYSQEVNGSIDYRQNRQRPILDVQSIIADYRQRHPETVPRRGRRIRNSHSDGKNSNSQVLNFSSLALGSGAQVHHNLQGLDVNSELGILLNAMDANRTDCSRPSSAESSTPQGTEPSFKDMLVQFAKLSQSERHELIQNVIKPPPPYPEVTVHPIPTTNTVAPTNSLLHGILTKSPSKTNTKTSFSPTLARLLTAPERGNNSHSPNTATISNNLNNAANMSISEILSTSKARNEITITPVGAQYETGHKGKIPQEEEEAEDSADRLVIDESTEVLEGRGRGDNSSDAGDEVPQCQGCNQKSALFVCAGCGNQWYCSRECQVSAWDEHSEVCSG